MPLSSNKESEQNIEEFLHGQNILNATEIPWFKKLISKFESMASLSNEFQDAVDGNLKALQDACTNSTTVLSNLTPNGETLLHYAVLANQVEVARWLFGKGVPVDATEKESNSTALHYAACGGNLEMVKLLADFKANFNCK